MAKEKVLITVKTYPTISTKYDELVCTAGLREDGTWIRLYPVPFRKLPYGQQYEKYDWIEVEVRKRRGDFRPESYSPIGEIKKLSHVDTGRNRMWDERRRLVLKKVYRSLDLLISEAKDKSIRTSLAVFRPAKILDFCVEECEREWSKSQRDSLRQMKLFEKHGSKFEVVRKLPYKWSYRFEDADGKKRELMVEDWEVGALYWRSVERHKGDEQKALADVRNKFLDELAGKQDLHFFLGTTYEFHARNALNPFIIVGVFYPPINRQMSLL